MSNNKRENTELPPAILKQEIENAAESLTANLTNFSEEINDLPKVLDNAFEFTLIKQRDVRDNLNSSYGILISLKKTALTIVGVIGAIQFVADTIVWKFLHGGLTILIGGAIVLIPYIILAFKFYSDEKWKHFIRNDIQISNDFRLLNDKQTEVTGDSVKSNIFFIFSEYKEKFLSNIRVVLNAAITFSAYGTLYRESLAYLENLRTFKDSFRRMLSRYNIYPSDSLMDLIEKYSGEHLPSNLWIDSIAEKIGEKEPIDPILLKLFFLETVNRKEENSNLMEKIIKDEASLNVLLKFLLDNELISVKFDFPEEWISKTLKSVVLENKTFLLPQVRSHFENHLYSIHTFLTRFTHMIETYEIDYPTPISMDFSPSKADNFETEYLKLLSSRIGLTKNVIDLLYHSIWDEQKSSQIFNSIITKSSSDLDNMAKFLLGHSFRTTSISLDNFSRIISGLHEFNLTEMRQRVDLLEKLILFEEQYLDYLANNNFPYNVMRLEIDSNLIKLASDDAKTNFEKYTELSKLMIRLPDTITKASLYHSVLVLIFLNDVSSPDAKEANNEAFKMKETLLVLYKYISLAQDSQPENRLSIVYDSIRHMDLKDEQDPVYSEFTWRIQQGQFVRYISSLMSPMLKELSKQYKEVVVSGNNEKFNDIMSKLFRKRIRKEQIIKMLSGNLIEAYLVTVPSKGKYTQPIISLISNTKELRNSESELSLELGDPSYEYLVQVGSAGTFTRIGIIPEGMSFQDFSIRFENVLRKLLNKSGSGGYPVYLTRVSASSQMTSVIMDAGEGENSPFVAIRDLANSVLPKEKLAALYAITNLRKSGKIGISDLVADIINSDYGGIINILPELPNGSVLSSNNSTSEEIKREINNQLLEQFNAINTTDLCYRIASQSYKLGPGHALKLISESILGQLRQFKGEEKYHEEISNGILRVATSVSEFLFK